jgi:hypothetical protein
MALEKRKIVRWHADDTDAHGSVKIRPIRVPGSNQIIKTKNNQQDLQDRQDSLFFEQIL